MLIRLLVALVVVAFAPSGASAQIYRWVDDRGGVHYTEGIGSVPEYLIQEKGYDTVIGYFRASVVSTDRLETFRQAFGDNFDRFEARFASHVRALQP